MFALGTVRSLVIDTVKSGKVQFDISAFLENVVLTDLNLSGWCSWFTYSILLVNVLLRGF